MCDNVYVLYHIYALFSNIVYTMTDVHYVFMDGNGIFM